MSESARTQKNRHVAVVSALDEDVLLLVRFQGVEHLGGLFEYELELTSEQPDAVNVDDVLGGPMTVRLELADGNYRYFNGLVSRFVMVTGEGEFPTYHATVVPWLWALTRTADCRIFHDTARQEWNVPKIVLQVFRDFGQSAFRDALAGTYQNLEYTVQYAETAFNFVSRLLEREGIYYFFEHAEDAHTLVLADAPTAHEPLPNYADPLIYRGRDRTHPGEEHISRWEVRKEVQPGTVALTAYDFKKPTNDLKVKSSVSRAHSQSDFEVFDFPGSYIERDVGEQYARVRLEEFQAHHEVIHAEANVRGIACGYTFKVTGMPGAEEQEFLVTSARYTIVNDPYASNGSTSASEPFSCQFTAIPGARTYRPARATPRPLIRGPQTAVVVGPPGAEIHTDQYSRVRVQFPWDRRGEFNEKSSCWIRVSQPSAGKRWGTVAIPRIGHEVVVEYIEGDPDRPLITGCVYNGNNMPPVSNAGRKSAAPTSTEQAAMMTTLRSNSLGGSGGHNEITLNDTGEGEGLFIKAQKDEVHTVGHDREDTVGNNETRKVAVDRTRDVGNNETVTIGKDETITVGNNRTVTITTNDQLSVGANQTIAVGANQAITVGGNKTETVSMAAAETIGLGKALTVGLGYQVSVGAIMNETVGGAKLQEIGGRSVVAVAGARTVDIGGDDTLTVSKKLKEKAKEIEVSADTKLVLKCGASMITLSPASIEIKAPIVKINC